MTELISGGIAPVPSNNVESSGLSGGAIFGIILAVAVAIVLGFVAYKNTCSQNSKSLLDFSTSYKAKNKNSSKNFESSQSFDNPNVDVCL